MKAMVLRRFGAMEASPLNFESVEPPEPREGEVLIRVKACGVCHTDLHTVEGDLPEAKLPIIPGHQVVGEVTKLGPNCSSLKPSDVVGVAWLYSACGSCSFCTSGRENLCLKARFTGFHVNGGYTEYMLAPEKFVYPLPKEGDPVHLAPLLCAGIIGYRSLRLSEIRPGQRLALFGFGASAHLAIQVARYWRCEIYVFSRSESHRQMALEMGASWVGTASETPPKPAQAAIIFAPAGDLVRRALEIVDRGGTVTLAGISMTPVPSLDYEKHLYYERRLQSVANSTREDGYEFLRLAAEVPIKTTVEVYSLREANQALLKLKRGKINGAAVLIMD